MYLLLCSLTMVYELITCVRRANENAGNGISVVQFLIMLIIKLSHLICNTHSWNKIC